MDTAREMANNLEAFRRDIGVFETAYAGMNTNYRRLFDDINTLGTTWEGPAHSAYDAQFKADAAMFEELLNLLKQIMDDLNFAHREYSTCEQNVRDLINNIRL